MAKRTYIKLAGTRDKLVRRHTPRPAMPARPAWLSAAARAEWDRVAPILVAEGLLCRADGDTLARYCEAWAAYSDAQRTLDRDGQILYRPSGLPYRHPAWRIVDRTSNDLFKLCRALGMSPLARSQLQD